MTSSESYFAADLPDHRGLSPRVALAAVHLLVRFRRSRGEERQQFKWFAGQRGLLLADVADRRTSTSSRASPARPSRSRSSPLPISVGIAVLRYRLYEIDRIIRRTLVYGVALRRPRRPLLRDRARPAAGLQRLSPAAPTSPIAGSTLAVAALFRPGPPPHPGFVDRRFYRRRYDAQRTLETFAARLRDEIDLDTLGAELRRVVRETMQPAHVSLWLRRSGEAVTSGRVAWALFGLSVASPPAGSRCGRSRARSRSPTSRGRPTRPSSSRSSPTRPSAP